MKNKIIVSFLFASLITSCGTPVGEGQQGGTVKPPEVQIETLPRTQILPKSVKKAIQEGYITIFGNSRGTYKEITVLIKNTSNYDLDLELDAGLFFQCPVDKMQSLVLTEDRQISLAKNEQKSLIVHSACTNAGFRSPTVIEDWPLAEAPKNLDVSLKFYGEQQDLIHKYLSRKNPEKFKSEEDYSRFLQVVIWYYLGNNNKEIRRMLTEHVYNGDIEKMNLWLNGISDDAKEIAIMIRNKDKKALKGFLIKSLSKTKSKIKNMFK